MRIDGLHERALVLEGEKVALVTHHERPLFPGQQPYTSQKVRSLAEFSSVRLEPWQMFGRFNVDLVNARGERLRITLEGESEARFAARKISNYIHQALPQAPERLAITA